MSASSPVLLAHSCIFFCFGAVSACISCPFIPWCCLRYCWLLVVLRCMFSGLFFQAVAGLHIFLVVPSVISKLQLRLFNDYCL
jgi:hypothetical protein